MAAAEYLAHRFGHSRIGRQEVVLLGGVQPPVRDESTLDVSTRGEGVLNGVGNLEFAARRWLDDADSLMNGRFEEVHPHERQVGLRIRGFLYQSGQASGLIDGSDAEG